MKSTTFALGAAVLVLFTASSAFATTIPALYEQMEMARDQIAAAMKGSSRKVDLKVEVSSATSNSIVVAPTIAVAPRPQGVASWRLTAQCESGLVVEFKKGLNFCRGAGLLRVSEAMIGKKGNDHVMASALLRNTGLRAGVATFILTAYDAAGRSLGSDTVRVTVGSAK